MTKKLVAKLYLPDVVVIDWCLESEADLRRAIDVIEKKQFDEIEEIDSTIMPATSNRVYFINGGLFVKGRFNLSALAITIAGVDNRLWLLGNLQSRIGEYEGLWKCSPKEFGASFLYPGIAKINWKIETEEELLRAIDVVTTGIFDFHDDVLFSTPTGNVLMVLDIDTGVLQVFGDYQVRYKKDITEIAARLRNFIGKIGQANLLKNSPAIDETGHVPPAEIKPIIQDEYGQMPPTERLNQKIVWQQQAGKSKFTFNQIEDEWNFDWTINNRHELEECLHMIQEVNPGWDERNQWREGHLMVSSTLQVLENGAVRFYGTAFGWDAIYLITDRLKKLRTYDFKPKTQEPDNSWQPFDGVVFNPNTYELMVDSKLVTVKHQTQNWIFGYISSHHYPHVWDSLFGKSFVRKDDCNYDLQMRLKQQHQP